MFKMMTVEMPDGTKWGVPVSIIAQNRAEYYASHYGGDVKRSLAEDTLPLFEASTSEIEDWAINNMNWSDFNGEQVRLSVSATDYEDGWANGAKGFTNAVPL